MVSSSFKRRQFLQGGAALTAAMTVPLGRVLAQVAAELPSIALPPPISAAERMGRLAKSRQLMQRHGIGSVIVESGPSLDYLTGIQW